MINITREMEYVNGERGCEFAVDCAFVATEERQLVESKNSTVYVCSACAHTIDTSSPYYNRIMWTYIEVGLMCEDFQNQANHALNYLKTL